VAEVPYFGSCTDLAVIINDGGGVSEVVHDKIRDLNFKIQRVEPRQK
jgi:hypothetical protein